jgi:hypothetical protein
MEERLAAYFSNWWNFAAWAAFRVWHHATDPIREAGFAERRAAEITREYVYRTLVQATRHGCL